MSLNGSLRGRPIAGPPVRPASPSLPVAALAEIATGLAQVERSVPAAAGSDPATPRSIRLIATSDYDVWLITWPPGSGIGYHEHEGATSVIRVVSGSLVESVEATHRTLRPGTSVVTAPHAPHQLRNATPLDTTSLHVYSPPLTAVTHFDAGAGPHPAPGDGLARTTPVRSRWAEATTGPRAAAGTTTK